MVDKRRFESHEIIVQSVGLVLAKVPLPLQSSIVFPLVGISFPFYSFLENEVASNCALTLENVTSDRYV